MDRNAQDEIAHSIQLAQTEFNRMNYSNALQANFRALTVQQKSLPPEHFEIGETYRRIAELYQHISDYFRGIYYSLKALAIFKAQKAHGEHSGQNLASIQYEIAVMYYNIGMLSRAEEYASAAINEYTRLGLYNHSNVNVLYNTLALIRLSENDFPGAIALCTTFLEQEMDVPPLDKAMIFHNLGVIYDAQEQYQLAFDHYSKARDIYDKELQFDHINNAKINMSLSRCCYHLERPHEGLRFRSHAGHHLVNLPDIDHFKLDYVEVDYQSLLNKYHRFRSEYMMANAILRAETRLMAQSIERGYYLSLSIPNKHLRNTFLRIHEKCFDLCFSFFATCPREFSNRGMYTLCLRTRKLNAEASFIQSYYKHKAVDDESKAILERLLNLRSELSRLRLAEGHSPDVISCLEQEIQEAELSLSGYIYQQVSIRETIKNVSEKEVMEALPDNAAIIEFVKYNFIKSDDDRDFPGDSGYYYSAFFIVKNRVITTMLPTCAQIDRYVRMLVSQTGSYDGNIAEISALSKYLYNSILSPLTELLPQIDHIFIAPEGDLYMLPFELLLNYGGHRSPSISYISTGRDVIGMGQSRKRSFEKAALLFDPVFDLDGSQFSSTGQQSGDTVEMHELLEAEQHARNITEVFSPMCFQRLPYTRVEAEIVARELSKHSVGVSLIHGDNATKQAALEITQPSILHISTHGFTLEYKQQEEPGPLLIQNRQMLRQNVEDPLLRCGLVLSGVCNWLRGEPVSDAYGDGILNGNDILSLDLLNTDLVVLSACRTGLGEAQKGEGIQGLRRSFELAGASSLICTLWEVNDVSSAIFMSAFYRNLLGRGMNKADSLSDAKDYLRRLTPQLLERGGWLAVANDLQDAGYKREGSFLKNMVDGKFGLYPFQHPYYWAGYILQGNVH